MNNNNKFIPSKFFYYLRDLSFIFFISSVGATNSSDITPLSGFTEFQSAIVVDSSVVPLRTPGSTGSFQTARGTICPGDYQPQVQLSVTGVDLAACGSGLDSVVRSFQLGQSPILIHANPSSQNYTVTYNASKTCMMSHSTHSGVYFSYVLYCYPPKS